MYVLGVDAGGTKTHCAIADKTGKIIGEGFSGSANHQICGIEVTINSLQTAIEKALAAADICLNDISYGAFGMSGADGEDDFRILTPAVAGIMGDIPFKIVNDSWIGLYSAIEDDMGVVSICGTGAGHAGQNRQGAQLTLRNLDYLCGNYGGGGELVQQGLHYAFRSNEGTYDKSLLEEMMPPIFGVDTMEEVCTIVKSGEMTAQQEFKIPIAVFEAAHKGDCVSQKLISDMGYEEGRYAAAIIRRLGMEKEKVPVVLIGSLFKTKEPLLVDSYMKTVKEAAPDAYAVIPEVAPVTGAIRMACRAVSNA